jgi:hypothetical protein
MMSRGEKAIFPKELLSNEMEEHNKDWLQDYKSKISHDNNVYYKRIKELFRFHSFEHKPFNYFTQTDLEDYVLAMWDNGYSIETSNVLVPALREFINFLEKDYSGVLPPGFLERLEKLRARVNEDHQFKTLPLIPTQIEFIRKHNERNINDEYIFELIFQLRIPSNKLKDCHPRFRNENQKRFVPEKRKSFEYNNKIASLLDKLGEDKTLILSISKLQSWLFRINRELKQNGLWSKERDLVYSDLVASHDKYVMKCPSCGEFTENISNDWVLVRSGEDEDYRLVCLHCKGVYLYYGKEN